MQPFPWRRGFFFRQKLSAPIVLSEISFRVEESRSLEKDCEEVEAETHGHPYCAGNKTRHRHRTNSQPTTANSRSFDFAQDDSVFVTPLLSF